MRNACLPLVRQIVFLSSPPTARMDGTSAFRKTGTGTNPRDRRSCWTFSAWFEDFSWVLRSEALNRKDREGSAKDAKGPDGVAGTNSPLFFFALFAKAWRSLRLRALAGRCGKESEKEEA